jgi:hypothetical protein
LTLTDYRWFWLRLLNFLANIKMILTSSSPNCAGPEPSGELGSYQMLSSELIVMISNEG